MKGLRFLNLLCAINLAFNFADRAAAGEVAAAVLCFCGGIMAVVAWTLIGREP